MEIYSVDGLCIFSESLPVIIRVKKTTEEKEGGRANNWCSNFPSITSCNVYIDKVWFFSAHFEAFLSCPLSFSFIFGAKHSLYSNVCLFHHCSAFYWTKSRDQLIRDKDFAAHLWVKNSPRLSWCSPWKSPSYHAPKR